MKITTKSETKSETKKAYDIAIQQGILKRKENGDLYYTKKDVVANLRQLGFSNGAATRAFNRFFNYHRLPSISGVRIDYLERELEHLKFPPKSRVSEQKPGNSEQKPKKNNHTSGNESGTAINEADSRAAAVHANIAATVMTAKEARNLSRLEAELMADLVQGAISRGESPQSLIPKFRCEIKRGQKSQITAAKRPLKKAKKKSVHQSGCRGICKSTSTVIRTTESSDIFARGIRLPGSYGSRQ